MDGEIGGEELCLSIFCQACNNKHQYACPKEKERQQEVGEEPRSEKCIMMRACIPLGIVNRKEGGITYQAKAA